MANYFDQFDAKPVDSKPKSKQTNYFDQFDEPAKPATDGNLLTDTATDLKAGVLKTPGMLAGLADIPAGLVGLDRPVDKLTDKIGEATGFTPGKWAEEAQKTGYSPERQQSDQNVQNAWDAYDKGEQTLTGAIGETLSNPRTLLGNTVESLPSMVAGGLGGKALLGAKALAPALGEGAVMAGQQMENIDDSVDPQKAAALSLGTGAIGAGLGYAGGKVAQKAGWIDPESAIGGIAQQAAPGKPLSTPARIAGGAASEGLLEELPQSIVEQGAQNIAEDKPLTQDMARSGVQGALAGGLMGGAFNTIKVSPITGEEIPPETETSGPLGAALNAGAVEVQAALPPPAKQLPAPDPALEFNRSQIPPDANIVFDDGSQTSAYDYFNQRMAEHGNEQKAREETYVALNGKPSPVIGIPELVFLSDGTSLSKADVLRGFMAQGYDEQAANDYLRKIVETPVEERTTVNLDPYRFLQERDANTKAPETAKPNDQNPVTPDETQAAQSEVTPTGDLPTAESPIPSQPTEVKTDEKQSTDQSTGQQGQGQEGLLKPFKPTHLLNDGTPVIEGEDSFGKYWQSEDGNQFDGTEPATPVTEDSNEQSQDTAPQEVSTEETVDSDLKGLSQDAVDAYNHLKNAAIELKDINPDQASAFDRTAASIKQSGVVSKYFNKDGITRMVESIKRKHEIKTSGQTSKQVEPVVWTRESVFAEVNRGRKRTFKELSTDTRIDTAIDLANKIYAKYASIGIDPDKDINVAAHPLSQGKRQLQHLNAALMGMHSFRDGDRASSVIDDVIERTRNFLDDWNNGDPSKPPLSKSIDGYERNAGESGEDQSPTLDETLATTDGKAGGSESPFSTHPDGFAEWWDALSAEQQYEYWDKTGNVGTGSTKTKASDLPKNGIRTQFHQFFKDSQSSNDQEKDDRLQYLRDAGFKDINTVDDLRLAVRNEEIKRNSTQVLNDRDNTLETLKRALDDIELDADSVENSESGLNKKDIYQRLYGIAKRLDIVVESGVMRFKSNGGVIRIPYDDQYAFGADVNTIFAHELGHAVMQKRGISYHNFLVSELKKQISNWDDLKKASQAYRPGIWKSDNVKIKNHANKPNEILADAIGSVLIGKNDFSLLSSLPLTKHDLGLNDNPDLLPSTVDNKPTETQETDKPDKKTRLKPFNQESLKGNEDALTGMAKTAGWYEVGGQLLRDDQGNVTGRTKWLPKADWYAEVPTDSRLNESDTVDAVRKAIAGEPMTAKEHRAVQFMLDYMEVMNAGGEEAKLDADLKRQAIIDEANDLLFESEDDIDLLFASSTIVQISGETLDEQIERIFGPAPKEIDGSPEQADTEGSPSITQSAHDQAGAPETEREKTREDYLNDPEFVKFLKSNKTDIDFGSGPVKMTYERGLYKLDKMIGQFKGFIACMG